MQQYQINNISTFTKYLGACCVSFVFLWGCTTTTTETESALQNAIEEEVEEIEEGNDPDIEIVDRGTPSDCVEKDERPTCHITTRGLNFIPIKIKSEVPRVRYRTVQRPFGKAKQKRNIACLRPRGGSTKEHARISLSDCNSTKKSLRWFKKDGAYPGGYRLENMNSGKCIERVGTALRQRTCANAGKTARNQTWNFKNTPPFGSGDLIESGALERGCVRAGNKLGQVLMSACQNDANRRWYQSAI